MKHHAKCPASQAWDIPNVPCSCPPTWPRKELTISRYTSTRRKPGPTAKARAKRKRADSKVADAVRVACVERDGHCRYGKDDGYDDCEGPAEWAHMGEKTRAKTRGMKPEARHTTSGSLMLCKTHHDCYDGRQYPRLRIEALTELGADGPLVFMDEIG